MAFQVQKVFIDTSFFMAFIDRVNVDHLKASQIFETLARQNFQVYTSYLVVTQTYNRLERELGATVADEFLQAILESKIQVIYPEQIDLLTVFRLLKNLATRTVNLSEMMNTILMDKQRVYSTLTFDSWHNLQKTTVSELLKAI